MNGPAENPKGRECPIIGQAIPFQWLKDLDGDGEHELAKNGWHFLGVGNFESSCESAVYNWSDVPNIHAAIYATFPDLRIVEDEPGWQFERQEDVGTFQIVAEQADGYSITFNCIGLMYFEMPDARRRIIRLRDLGRPTLELQLFGPMGGGYKIRTEFLGIHDAIVRNR